MPSILVYALLVHGLLALAYLVWSLAQTPPVKPPKEELTFEMVSPPGEAPPSPVPAITNPPAADAPVQQLSEEVADAPDELSAQNQAKVKVDAPAKVQTNKALASNSTDGLPLPVLKAPANPGGGGNVLGGYKARLQYLVNQAAQQIVPDDDLDEDAFVELAFVIQRSGAKSVRISRSSGSANFDRQALRAVQNLEFPPLPALFEEPSLTVTLRVNPMD